jgi:hypothetical protein
MKHGLAGLVLIRKVDGPDAGFGGQVGGYHENRLNVSRLQKNRFKPSLDQAGVQPLRQRICFEPDPRNREAKSFKELDTVSLRW